ncbi:MAG: tellurium resistance protein [Desulfosporosinus sp. BRH_c37]|nr:MAG: tellurium resistance protein [Desulfosporosinus sp. BRH_c37]
MNQSLQQGGNPVLNGSKGSVIVSHDISITIDVSLTAFLVTDESKVQGDSGIVFYNHPEGPSGMAMFISPHDSGNTRNHKIDFDLNKAPSGITKIAVTLTEDNDSGFSNVSNLKAEVHCGGDVIQLAPSRFTTENGIVVLELYLMGGKAKVRAIWRGFDSGLDGLCKNYGVEVSDEGAPSSGSNQKQVPTLQEAKPTIVGSTMIEKPNTSLINLQKTTGKVNLSKGQGPILIDKTPEITATVSWKTGTDYDIYALVYTKKGQQVDVAMFGAQGVSPLQRFDNGAVEHMGDVGRNSKSAKTEIIKIRLNDNILAVVPVVYSAQSNGTGSFYRYKVSMCIDNHQGTNVTISSDNANNNDRIYTCVPGILLNTLDGVVISPVELYSKPSSENRPLLKMGPKGIIDILMDKGPKNNYK